MKTALQTTRRTERSARIEELADLLLDEVDDDVDGVDAGWLDDAGLRGRSGAFDFGSDDSVSSWR